MKKLSNIEKVFNLEARKHGCKSFTKTDFDTDEELNNIMRSIDKEGTFDEEFQLDAHLFLDTKINAEGKESMYLDNDIIESTQKIFNISHIPTAKSIAHKYYHDTYCSGFYETINADGEFIQQTVIMDKIEKFHHMCTEADKVKQYIIKSHPRWQKYTKQEKKQVLTELQSQIQSLKELGMDTRLLQNVYNFMTNYQLNQVAQLKADYLLFLKLPNVDNLKIAKNIVNYMYR